MDRTKKLVRCAIYTRKSTEDGLEQEYNSLDAQYDACTAYALSQRHEGWTVTKDRYDDGGFSGGTLERPGLIPTCNDHNPLAHLRCPMVIMRQG
jgi:DNA invertase Pin-like site-specific DNA recombinase